MTPGQNVSVERLSALNKALRANGNLLAKAAQAGYPAQGQAVTGGDYAALIPQSIQNTLDTASFTEHAIKFWTKIFKQPVASTLHESAVTQAYGEMALDPFISEGGVGSTSDGVYDRKIVKIKYLAEKREISDVATMVGIVGYNGVSKQGLAQQTLDGTRALLGKTERALFNANSSLSPLHFDGLFRQIARNADDTAFSANYSDLEGEACTPQKIIERMYQVADSPNFGFTNLIMVPPRLYASLVAIAMSYGRFDQAKAGHGELVFGSEGLKIVGPGGLIPVEQCPLMLQPQTVTAGVGTIDPSAAVAVQTQTAASIDAASRFRAKDEGDYKYSVVGVGDKGVNAETTDLNVVSVATGEKVTFTLNDDGLAAAGTPNGIRYYRVYRSAADDTTGARTHMVDVARNLNADGTPAGKTTITDLNEFRPGTAPVYLLQMTPDVMYWAQLLDFIRRPLAQVTTTVPFLLMLFGALHVKVPTKCWVIGNAAQSL